MSSPPPRFSRTIEDFQCVHCGAAVKGNGFTNHCPSCLWSLHVDVNPGDRAAECQGRMEPVSVEVRSGDYTLVHRCLSCGFERRQRSAKSDDFEAILRLVREKGMG